MASLVNAWGCGRKGLGERLLQGPLWAVVGSQVENRSFHSCGSNTDKPTYLDGEGSALGGKGWGGRADVLWAVSPAGRFLLAKAPPRWRLKAGGLLLSLSGRASGRGPSLTTEPSWAGLQASAGPRGQARNSTDSNVAGTGARGRHRSARRKMTKEQ